MTTRLPCDLCPSPERVLHLSLNTAVRILISAPFPRRKGRNWTFALSQGERVDRDRRFHQPARAG
jgi:hypothetical protein